MPFYPTLTESYTTQLVTDIFSGYNHNMKIGDGEFYDMKNLTSDFSPLLANRVKRGMLAALENPVAILGKSQLAYIDGTHLYYGDLDLSTYWQAKGLVLSEDEAMLPKQLVSMGAYIVVFPDHLYINTEKFTDCGSMDMRFSSADGEEVRYDLCKVDGTVYDTPMVGATAPESPSNGALWVDTSGDVHSLKQYTSATSTWTVIPTVYTKISCGNIGIGFEKNDGVHISGCAATSEHSAAMQAQLEELNGSKVILDKGDDHIIVIGLLDQSYVQTEGTVTVARVVPEMDFVTEANNRLWGCKYGLVDGKTVNEIYCCALGDFKNWEQYQGIATDSYRASVGTDGPWTGAVTHLGYPLFFKEHCMHKVYVSSSGAHQIVDTACRGVQKGSHNSLSVVNETLFYKGVNDVCAYDGSLPQSVSSQLGGVKYFDGVAGTLGDKYYLSMRDSEDIWHLFVLDTAKGVWHKEDNVHVLQFARCGGELYYIDGDDGQLIALTGTTGTPEDDIEWMAETGLVGYSTVEQKYVSRFNLRMRLPVRAWMDIFIQYDSDGQWYNAGHVNGAGMKSFTIPVRPRRCDHFKIRLQGCGDVRIYSFARIYEVGSDIV